VDRRRRRRQGVLTGDLLGSAAPVAGTAAPGAYRP
jgi:hypothetical protein